MLVLTRKVKQQIQIGENIVVTLLQIRGQTVRVGIEAPRQVRVVRSEIADVPAIRTQPPLARVRSVTAKSARAAAARTEGEEGFSSPLAGCAAPIGATTSSPIAIRR